jgi:hypothetical protein
MIPPETRARQNIDAQLASCGWMVQDRNAINLLAGRGVAVREFPVESGYADYLLFVDKKAAGVIEAKAEGITLMSAADQAGSYAVGNPSLGTPFEISISELNRVYRDEKRKRGKGNEYILSKLRKRNRTKICRQN